jgi:hypothetical protein
MLLFIDPAVDVGVDMPWVLSDGYVKEDGINITLDQGGPTVLFDIWALEVDNPANPIITGPQNNAGANNYGVAYSTDAADLALSIADNPDPYVLNSGAVWNRTYTIENLGESDTDNVVVSLSATGITDSTFAGLVISPNSTFNSLGEFKWRMATLESGEVATLTVRRIFGPGQALGTNVVTSFAQIDSADIFDPDPSNNTAEETTSIYDIPLSITGVTRLGGSTNCEPSPAGLLFNGSEVYCDQAYTWIDIPREAEGAIIDYIKVADADSSVGDYGLSFTVALPGTALLFIDPAVDVGSNMPWVISDGYLKEDGINFTLGQGGPTVIFDIWTLDIDNPANPVITGPQNDGGANNYGVAYATDTADLAVSIVAEPDPYIVGSGANWTRTYTIENLGPGDTENTVVTLDGSGVNDSSFVSLSISPNSSFNSLGQLKWRMPVLDMGDTATLTIVRTFGPDQAQGIDVVTNNVSIDSSDTFDPDPSNNADSETTSVLTAFDADTISKDSFESQ